MVLISYIRLFLAKENTEFGKLIEGTKYSEYSIENKFLLDDETFIETNFRDKVKGWSSKLIITTKTNKKHPRIPK